jgi:hypothetical protein
MMARSRRVPFRSGRSTPSDQRASLGGWKGGVGKPTARQVTGKVARSWRGTSDAIKTTGATTVARAQKNSASCASGALEA